MTEDPLLPPPYRLVRLAAGTDSLAAAVAAAGAGDEEGSLYWAAHPKRLDAALLLAPDRPRRHVLPVVHVAALGLADALGTLAPPTADLTFGWPAVIEVNGGVAGRLRVLLPPGGAGEVPPWLVLGLDLALAADEHEEEPGRHPERTTLAEEGFEDITAAALLESFSRHFLAWLGAWDEDGLARIAEAWRRRLRSFDDEIIGLDEEGGLILRRRTLPLADALLSDARDRRCR
jgi:biotin-(acetyl-CoA carboxylase) ligase